jgi:hypothetical protein
MCSGESDSPRAGRLLAVLHFRMLKGEKPLGPLVAPDIASFIVASSNRTRCPDPSRRANRCLARRSPIAPRTPLGTATLVGYARITQAKPSAIRLPSANLMNHVPVPVMDLEAQFATGAFLSDLAVAGRLGGFW